MPRRRTISNLMGVDDAPFHRTHRGDVRVVGAVVARTRLDGLVVDRVRRDGVNAAARVASMLRGSRFDEHVQAVLINGIALAGFNVVDLHALHDAIDRPVLVVARKQPNLGAIRRALLTRVPGGARKWRLIERAGPMEPLEGVWVQRVGLDRTAAAGILRRSRSQGRTPEPLRIAHMVAAAIGRGTSGGSA